MKETQWIMGMPITVEIVDLDQHTKIEIFAEAIKNVFDYFMYVDATFSTYKEDSEISRINRNELKESEYSDDMKTIFALSEQTRIETSGYFDIRTPAGVYDPSGLVKGWSIYNASKLLEKRGFKNFYIEAGGDIAVAGLNALGKSWSIGIRDPLGADKNKIVKTIYLTHGGMATSGTYLRGQHIYNPHQKGHGITDIVSLTVIGPNVYEADRFATAAFAMGANGIYFIEKLVGFEGYMIDTNGIATFTTNFEMYTQTQDSTQVEKTLNLNEIRGANSIRDQGV
jgi:thiamine biosynthesis lipoprotein